MSDHEKELKNARLDVMRVGMVAAEMQTFAARIIWHVRNGGSLDDDTLAEIARQCILRLKNLEITGAPIELEADLIGKVVEYLEQHINTAIAWGQVGKP